MYTSNQRYWSIVIVTRHSTCTLAIKDTGPLSLSHVIAHVH